jgi:hypothetical protein
MKLSGKCNKVAGTDRAFAGSFEADLIRIDVGLRERPAESRRILTCGVIHKSLISGYKVLPFQVER